MLVIAQFLSLYVLEICVLLLVGGTIRNLRVTCNYYWLIFAISISVSVWAYSFDPTPNFDLYRLYQNIQAMHPGDWKSNIITNAGNYSGLYAFNALCYLVSLIGDNRFLSVISALSVFSILLGVLISYFRSEGYSSRGLMFSIAMIFAGMQIQYVFSGVRNSMAVSLTILSLYCFFYKKRFRIASVVLYLAACTIHPMVLIILPVVLLSNVKAQKLLRTIALFIVPAVFKSIDIMYKIPIGLFQNTAKRLETYQFRAYGSDRPEMIANTVFFIILGWAYWYLTKKGIITRFSEKHRKFENLYYLLGFAMTGSIVHRDFALRLGYFMDILNVPVLCKVFFSEYRMENHTLHYRRMIGYILLFALGCILICMFKVYYDSVYTLKRMTFIGILSNTKTVL